MDRLSGITPRLSRCRKPQRGSWIGTRRVAPCTFPHPLRLEPGVRLSPHRAHHLRSFSRGKRPEAFLRISPAYTEFTVDSLRVRWVPLLQSFRRLGAFAISPRPGVPSFPELRLLCPIRLPMKALAFHTALAFLGVCSGYVRKPVLATIVQKSKPSRTTHGYAARLVKSRD